MSDQDDKSGALVANGEFDDANEIYRDYYERRRPLHRARAERALADAKELLEQESDDSPQLRAILSASEHLERLAECLADEPLPCVSADMLDTEEWLEYDELRYQHGVTGNMPMLLDAFVILVENDISPGRWILEPLAEAFGKILDDPDVSLVASYLHLQGKGSGSSSPLQDYSRQIIRSEINLEMRCLIEEFDVSRMNAANAVIEKHGIDLQPKTLVNQYQSRAKFPKLVRKLLDDHMEIDSGPAVWLTKGGAQEFLDSFPPSARKYLKSARPPRT